MSAVPGVSTSNDGPRIASGLGPLANSRVIPPVVLAVLGVGLGAVTTRNLLAELSDPGFGVFPVVAALQGYVPATLVLLGAYWLLASDHGPMNRWRVALSGAGGLVVFGGVTALTVIVRVTEGRTVEEPLYVLFTTAGVGCVVGILVGALYARSRRDAAQARATRDQLEVLNSVLRHDVQNSIMIIRSRAKYIRENAGDRIGDFADTIVTQSNDIADQIDRTRAVIDSLVGDERPLQATSLTDALDGAVETLRDTYDDLEVRVDAPDEAAVRADEMLEDVLGNVLGNAVEHNDKETPEIEVTVETGDDHVDLRVADNGPGVPDGQKQAVFGRGRTTDGADAGGFGLFFVATMLDEYGGDVRVEDNDPEGAVFVLRFPRAG